MMHSNNVSNFFYFVVVILKADGKPEEKNKFEGGSPRIIEAILDGEQPEGFALTDIDKTFSPVWDEQAEKFGFTFRHG